MTLKVTQEIWARNLQKESVSGPRNRQKTSVSGARNSKKRICLFSGARNREKGLEMYFCVYKIQNSILFREAEREVQV